MYQAFHCEGAKRTTKIFSPCEQHLSIGQQRGARVLCINLTSTRKASSKRLAFLRSAAIDLPAIASYHSLTDGHAVTTRRPEQLALPHRRAVGWRGDGSCVQAEDVKLDAHLRQLNGWRVIRVLD